MRDSFFCEHVIICTDKGELQVRSVGRLELEKKLLLVRESVGVTMQASKDQRFLLAGCSDGEMAIVTNPRV
jgi:hypothetical protein